MKKIFIYTHSCKLRSIDAYRVYKYFSLNDYQIINTPKEADVIFYISCAAHDQVAKKSLDIVENFQKYDAELIVAGCLPVIEDKNLGNIFKGKTIATKDFDKNPHKIDNLFPENKIKFKDIDDPNFSFENIYEGLIISSIRTILNNVKWIEKIVVKIKDHVLKNLLNENSFFYGLMMDKPMFRIRISWGCINNCSYCAIKGAIGEHNSKPIEQCVKEFQKGLKKGYKHLLINADDIGAYGIDIGSSFPELLDKITSFPEEYRITIANLNPIWVVKYINELEEIMKRKKIVRLCIPIQSGSNRVLKSMQRFSDIEKIKESLKRLNKAYPEVLLSTHVIVGFPSETDDEFKKSLEFIKDVDLNAGQVIPFSSKTGTKAEEIQPKVSETNIYNRLKMAKSYLKSNGYTLISHGYGTISLPSRNKIDAFLFEKND
jgi:tRNA A37 methylthiotransferase MiaB